MSMVAIGVCFGVGGTFISKFARTHRKETGNFFYKKVYTKEYRDNIVIEHGINLNFSYAPPT